LNFQIFVPSDVLEGRGRRAVGESSAGQLRWKKREIKQPKGHGVEREGHGRILEGTE